jgi:MFS transporter, DHA2 family, multidrug resistance protein
LIATPPEKAGAASAISETGADLGGSFGVVILGSIGVAVYRGTLVVPVGVVPAQSAAARDTLGGAVDVAASLPDPIGRYLLTSAQEAFTHALQVATGAGVVVLLAMTALFAWTTLWRTAAQRPSISQGEI